MFDVKVLTEFDIALEVPELAPEILEVEFDKCDPCKVTFTVYVELPRVLLTNPTVDLDPEDGNEDTRVLSVEHRICTSGHLSPLEMSVFTIYPLAGDNSETGTGAVSSMGIEDECYSFEQCRVPCKPASPAVTGPTLPRPDSYRVTFPLDRAVACLLPELGLSGFYLKQLVSANLKSKVRLVSTNNPNADTVAALLTYDPERCEGCIEVCEDQETYDCIVNGYEHLFKGTSQPSLSEQATNRRYSVRGLSKCTEKDLFSFEICFKPPLVPLDAGNTGYMNYGIVALDSEHWCYEFRNKTTDEILIQ